jgi:single-stranded DNA-binding protein
MVVRVYERTTKAGEPCYFLKCQDAQASTFSVVVWDWQWERLQEQITEGSRITVDVRVPREGYSAFTLA